MAQIENSIKMEPSKIIKVIFVGDRGTGKTLLLKKMTTGEYRDTEEHTIGVDFIMTMSQTSNGANVALQLWDTAGDDRYRQIVQHYVKGATAIVMCFDTSDHGTFENLSIWFDKITMVTRDVKLYVVGTKNDLVRQVTIEDAKDYANQIGATYIETSAKLNTDKELQRAILGQICDAVDIYSSDSSSSTDENDTIALIDKSSQKNRFACCAII